MDPTQRERLPLALALLPAAVCEASFPRLAAWSVRVERAMAGGAGPVVS